MEELTRAICDKSIRYRMTNMDIDHSPIKSPKLFLQPAKMTMKCVENMVDIIVTAHPELYTEITFKLNITIQDERTVCRTYRSVIIIFYHGSEWSQNITFAFHSMILKIAK